MQSFEVDYVKSRHTRPGIATIVYGLNPIPGQLDGTIRVLSENNDIFTYTYPASVVLAGEPGILPELIEDIKSDIQDKAAEYDEERLQIVGASLGAFIGFNVQKELLPLAPGLYATAGVNVAKNTWYNPIFLPAKRAFQAAGYGLEELQDSWAEHDIYRDKPASQDVPFVCAISRLDPVVPYWAAHRNLREWQDGGSRLKILRNYQLGHTAAINCFDSGIREVIEVSKSL